MRGSLRRTLKSTLSRQATRQHPHFERRWSGYEAVNMEEAEQQRHLRDVSIPLTVLGAKFMNKPSGFEGFEVSCWEERRLADAHSEGLYGTL